MPGRTNAFDALFSVAAAQVCTRDSLARHQHGGAHLLACKTANRSAEKTRALPEASFLEAVKLEACRLDRSGGSLYDAFAAGCPLPQVRINLLLTLAIRTSYYAAFSVLAWLTPIL